MSQQILLEFYSHKCSHDCDMWYFRIVIASKCHNHSPTILNTYASYVGVDGSDLDDDT